MALLRRRRGRAGLLLALRAHDVARRAAALRGGARAQVERQELHRGDRVAAIAAGEGELEIGLVCSQSYDVWRRIGNDSRSRVTDNASVWQEWVPAPHGALGQRVELALPADGPYSYEGDCVVVGWAVVVGRVGEKRVAEPVPLWVAP